VSLPLVAIVGAPNVGKSTLFNRLVRGREAIVTDQPGVTRDRQYREVEEGDVRFRVVDTGGMTPGSEEGFAAEIGHQARVAIDEADVVLFLVDARCGINAVDQEIASRLRRIQVPLLLVANKTESAKRDANLLEFHELGLGDPISISAEHGEGISALLDHVLDELRQLPQKPEDDPSDDEAEDRPLRLAIVGRPNVGKSSLLNRLVGEQRVVVSEIPGTTRDAIDTLLTVGDRRYLLVDTAGMRRRGRVERGIERHSVGRAQNNIERCDVTILVLDADAGFGSQDAHIAGYVRDAFRPVILAVNKWDLISEREQAVKTWEDTLETRLKFLKGAPSCFISALSGQRVFRLLEMADRLHQTGGKEVTTVKLNRWLQVAAGPHFGGRSGSLGARFYYATQTGIRPPRFRIFCNDPRKIHFSTQRQLENGLRETFGFSGVPLRIDYKRRRETPTE